MLVSMVIIGFMLMSMMMIHIMMLMPIMTMTPMMVRIHNGCVSKPLFGHVGRVHQITLYHSAPFVAAIFVSVCLSAVAGSNTADC